MDVQIVLQDSEGKKYLAFSTIEKQKKGGGLITGMAMPTGNAVQNVTRDIKIEQSSELKEVPDEDLYPEEFQVYMKLLEGEVESSSAYNNLLNYVQQVPGTITFELECKETCVLEGLKDNEYEIVFDIEPGTIAYVDKIYYSLLDMS